MIIPKCLVWAMGEDGCTAVKIFCEENLREKIASRFTEVFNEEYEKLMDLIEEEEGDCNEKDEGINPFKGAQVTDYGVFLPFDSLAMYCGYGDHLSCHDAGEALEDTLKAIKQEYLSISYEGYVVYWRSDVRSGEACQYEISSEKKRKKDNSDVVYDFVGEALGFALQDEEAWDSISDELDGADENDFKRILKLFHLYSKWIPEDATDKIIELAEETDEDMEESLKGFVEALKSGEDVEIEEDEIDTSGLSDDYNIMEAMEMFMKALKDFAETEEEEDPISIVFKGKIFVLTGFDSRDKNQITEIITSRGGIVKSSTVLNTDYLIYDERYGKGTKKHERALELNSKGKSIQIIAGKAFLRSVK